MKHITRWLCIAVAVACLFPLVSSPAYATQPQVPGSGPVVTDTVTNEELYVIASWENSVLMNAGSDETTLHYPLELNAQDCTDRGCENGCTIGYGYNFGAHSAEKIVSDFHAAGIDEATARLFTSYAKITGIDAVALCGRNAPNRDDLPTLTTEQAWELLRHMAAEHKANVVRRAEAEGLTRYFNSGQFAIMVALDYQNPVLSSQATYIWQQLARGDMDAVLYNIRHQMGTRFAPGLQPRRNWEASYFSWATSRQRAAGQFNWPTETDDTT